MTVDGRFRRDRPTGRHIRARLARARRIAACSSAVVLLVGGCLGAPVSVPAGTTGPAAAPSLSNATELARVQLEGALKAAGFGLIDVRTPYRPAESPALTPAPRAVFQVVLENSPSSGYVIIYEFPDTAAATTAGTEMAAYLGSGPGRVQFPPDTQHVLRQVGSTLLFYSWSPANTPDPRAADIPVALATLGQGIAIPR